MQPGEAAAGAQAAPTSARQHVHTSAPASPARPHVSTHLSSSSRGRHRAPPRRPSKPPQAARSVTVLAVVDSVFVATRAQSAPEPPEEFGEKEFYLDEFHSHTLCIATTLRDCERSGGFESLG